MQHAKFDWILVWKKVTKKIMKNTGLEEAQAGIKMPGEISITSDMQMTPPLWQKVKKKQEPLDESERGE